MTTDVPQEFEEDVERFARFFTAIRWLAYHESDDDQFLEPICTEPLDQRWAAVLAAQGLTACVLSSKEPALDDALPAHLLVCLPTPAFAPVLRAARVMSDAAIRALVEADNAGKEESASADADEASEP